MQGCDALQNFFCSTFDSSCCPPCAAKTQAYLDCIVESSFLQTFCPGSKCTVDIPEESSTGSAATTVNTTTAGNTTMSNMTETTDEFPEVEGDSILDSGMGGAGAGWSFCANNLKNVFDCYLNQCAERECESELGEAKEEMLQ